MSNITMNSDRAAKLRARLATAREREAELKAEIKKLERKADIAYSTICNIEEELAELEVRSWGGIPNWKVLLQAKNSMFMYHALEHCLNEIGLHMGFGIWSDNSEKIVAIALDSGDTGAVARNAAAMRAVAPHMKPHKGGWVWFNIHHHCMSDCAWTLRIALKTGKVELVQEVHFSEEQRIECATLEAALAYVQANLWNQDYIDQGSNTTLVLEAN